MVSDGFNKPIYMHRYEIFMRGSTSDSYGIDYVSGSDVFRAGVRSGSTSYIAQKAVTDAGLGWHHVAFTYESGSSTGVKIYVDAKSYLYLMGTIIDFVDELNQSGFKFVNPNAKRTCGCGESFSI